MSIPEIDTLHLGWIAITSSWVILDLFLVSFCSDYHCFTSIKRIDIHFISTVPRRQPYFPPSLPSTLTSHTSPLFINFAEILNSLYIHSFSLHLFCNHKYPKGSTTIFLQMRCFLCCVVPITSRNLSNKNNQRWR